MNNLLVERDGLPRYSDIEIQQIESNLLEILNDNRTEIENILRRVGENPTWASFFDPLDELSDRLERAWSPISYLKGVANTPELREAHDACLPHLSSYRTELTQSEPLYRAWLKLETDASVRGDPVKQKIVSDALREFELAGVALPENKKARFSEIRQRLSLLSSTFSNNALDATNAWTKHVGDESVLDGVPIPNKEVAKQEAQSRGMSGFLITLSMPSYSSVLGHAHSRELRRELFEAYASLASDVGPHAGRFDNTPIISEILALRRELAQLLGYRSFADVSVVRKMAASAKEIHDFLHDLLSRARPIAQRELAELREFAHDEYGLTEIKPWDLRYLGERLRESRYNISDEMLRPYFQLDHVIAGMFKVAERLYGIQFCAEGPEDTWHSDVRFYEIRRDGQRIARFSIDPFARLNKRSGAWMADCRNRREVGNYLQIPVAYLTCNSTPGSEDVPPLLTHTEVITLFHEFGHGLHHMLTQQKFAPISGLNGVPWDAVELPSQFMENWCWEVEGLNLISRHVETEEPLSSEFVSKLIGAKNFHAGLHMVRQIEFGLLDLTLHDSVEPIDAVAMMRDIRNANGLLAVEDCDRFPCSFGHIFAGGYAAGYYSYLWAEVLSADAFSLFQENGIFDAVTGKRFLTRILEAGGSQDAADMFKSFRGREPRVDALLRQSGLVV